MIDGAIKGTGNSRYLKSVSNFLSLYPTYADFVAALVAGTLPIDLNGLNAAGWTTLATALIKANLLDDATAAALVTALGGATPVTVNEALAKLAVPSTLQKLGELNPASGTSTSFSLSGVDLTKYSELFLELTVKTLSGTNRSVVITLNNDSTGGHYYYMQNGGTAVSSTMLAYVSAPSGSDGYISAKVSLCGNFNSGAFTYFIAQAIAGYGLTMNDFKSTYYTTAGTSLTSLDFSCSNNFVSGDKFILYGVKK